MVLEQGRLDSAEPGPWYNQSVRAIPVSGVRPTI